MNRIDRITAILIQLQSKRVVKAQEIANRFEISLRTVYRDIRTLEEAGVPLISEAGIGYSIMEGYRLPPVMFTEEEATAFLTAEKLVEKLTDQTTAQQYHSAMYKVKSVLRSREKEFLEDLNQHIQVVDYAPALETTPQQDLLQKILKSVIEQRVLKIRYRALQSDEVTERDIEPIGVYFSVSQWYLIAFCRWRDAYRNFRFDRMIDLQTTSQLFKKRGLTLNTYLEQMAEQRELETVIVLFDKKYARYAKGQRYYHGFVSERQKGNQVEMTFLTTSVRGMARWLLMFTDKVEIVSPDSLRNELFKLVESLQKHFQQVY